MSQRGRGRGKLGKPSKSTSQQEIRAPVRAFNIMVDMDHKDPEIITGIFYLFDEPVFVLIDPGSTHSYISTKLIKERNVPLESITSDIIPTNPMGQSAKVNRICRNYPIDMQGMEFPVNLIELPFKEFEIILGMDWLSLYLATVDCPLKRLTLRDSKGVKVMIVGERMNPLSNVISIDSMKKLLLEGCQAFLANVVDTRTSGVKLEDNPTVREYPAVFLDELLRIPLDREVEFKIEVLSGTAPITMAPYKMAPTELQELKTQLQELLDRGFIRPSVTLECTSAVCEKERWIDAIMHRLPSVK